MYIASVQCLLHFGRAFSAGSIYPRYVRLTVQLHMREKSSSVLAYIGISFLYSRSGVLTYFQVQRAGEGFQVAGSPDPEAKRLNVLFALPLK